jgi:hypothetical protein
MRYDAQAACPRRRVIFTQGGPRVRHEHALGMLGPGLDEIDPLLVRRCASGIAVMQPSARLANHRGSHKGSSWCLCRCYAGFNLVVTFQ